MACIAVWPAWPRHAHRQPVCCGCVDGDTVTLLSDAGWWLRGTDPCVRALFGSADRVVSRTAILAALIAHTTRPPSAAVWLVGCAWLRPAGYHGHYTLALPNTGEHPSDLADRSVDVHVSAEEVIGVHTGLT